MTSKRITSHAIESIKSASISQVVGHYVPLKKKGANYEACCPFHNEKSASFTVSEAKDMYKCFGCGAGGDAIRFVMEHQKQSFIEAVTTISQITGIALEYEEREYTEAEKQTLSAAEAQEAVLNHVIPVYRQQLYDLPADHPVKQYLYTRGFTDEVIAEWQLGWAGTDWHHITPQLINKGWHEAATKLGIIKRSKSSDSNFDGYRSRITIPISDRSGRYIGLAGRFLLIDPADEGKEFPKYINPADCELYNKSTVLFGLNKAANAIRKTKCAVLVEGNLDVIAMHSKGIENTVGTSGTAFTKQQMAALKKHSTSIACMFDNDDAGQKAFQRSLPELLSNGFQVSRVPYTGKDPDEWVQKNGGSELSLPKTEDAVLFRCRELMEDAADDVMKKSDAKRLVLELVAEVANDILRSNYLDTIISKYKWNKGETKRQFDLIASLSSNGDGAEGADDDGPIKLPDWLSEDQREHFMTNGYVPVRRQVNGKWAVGYWGFNQNGKQEISNFTVQPLFHVYAGAESRYMLQIDNGYRKAVLDIPAKSIPSIDQFQAFTVAEGNYLIFGAKAQWLRIASDLLQRFPRCIEIKTLGWQPAGFYAFVDKIYHPLKGAADLDQWGIYKCDETNYLIPASCEAYQQLVHTGEDPYENDRHLTYKKSPVTFAQWADMMQRVYLKKGVVGVAAVILAAFRDLVFEVDNNCPHMYAFGEPSSGKSKWAESISAVFYLRRSAFNLNSGTDFAFFSYMQRYRNAPAHLNEFDHDVLKPEWFQAIKGVYDGEGRERGKGGSKNRTEVMKVHSLLVLTGQKLITADDNSVVTRSLIEPFSVREDLSEEDKLAYTQLKGWEAQGLSSMLTELLAHRPMMQQLYQDSFNKLLSYWRKEHPESRSCNQRILQNYAHLATGYALISKHIDLPMGSVEFTAYCLEGAKRWSAFIRSSDTLSEFWKTLEFLADTKQIAEGWDYTIEEVTSVRIRNNRNEEVVKDFDAPTKVLFLRLNKVHKLFQSSFKLRAGKEAMNEQNLLHYFSGRGYFLGPVKQKQFKRFADITDYKSSGGMIPGHNIVTEKKEEKTISSCHAFLYEDLGIEIERMADDGMEAPF